MNHPSRTFGRRRILQLGASSFVYASPLIATARAFPTKHIRLISPYPAGGAVDQVSRALSDSLAAELRQPVVAEALPGAGGSIGTQVVAKSDADGHTWLMATPSHIATPYLQPTPYDPVRDFKAAAVVGSGRAVAVVPATSSARTMADLIRLAKARPGELNYLNAGNGSVAHMSTELFKLHAKISMQAVLYKGLPPGVQDLAAGRLDFGFVSLQVALPLITAGRLRAIAISTPVRQPDLPEVMTLDEQGFATSYIPGWFMVCVPAATPRLVIDRINAAVNKSVAAADVRKNLATAFVTPALRQTPEQCQSLLLRDHQRIGVIIKEAKIKAS
ncbi:tripartite tricarboxylate transporter substrate binding protein [Ramlibacter sp. WS9]|uniref:Bug family tripartite tricarboxylate transporter substrate binding protein n=1 Tax=Ramlibacter sp. WS9 TaxID=1882741 RepID=UPI001305179B|nr:tripartite tricarboxylate transporter substrate binding protein [Ramlibacter sp. WS9]HSV36666.1 tripartite tricarboxylate transporter substrate binding protein [Ramlibacter sp.]